MLGIYVIGIIFTRPPTSSSYSSSAQWNVIFIDGMVIIVAVDIIVDLVVVVVAGADIISREIAVIVIAIAGIVQVSHPLVCGMCRIVLLMQWRGHGSK